MTHSPAQIDNTKDPGHRVMELRSLFEMSKILNSSLKLRDILNSGLLTPMGRMMVTRGFALVSEKKHNYRIEAVKGVPAELVGTELSFQLDGNEPLFVDDVKEDDIRTFFQSHSIDLILPLRGTNRVVGAVCFGRKLTGQDFNKNEIEFLDSLSNITATAVENALMYNQLKFANRKLDKKVQELNSLFEIGKQLNASLEPDQILNILLFTVMGEMAVHKILIYLREENELKLKMFKGLDERADVDHVLSNPNFLHALTDLTEPLIIEKDASHILQSLHKLDFKVIVPMRIQEDTCGALILGERVTFANYQPEDLEFLSSLGNRVMISLENARLFQETIEKQRMEEELAIARRIQTRLLPRSFPQYPDFDIYGFNIPSRAVGGDFFDCIQLDENHFALAIGDVSGKGVGASLLMSNLHAGLHSLVQSRIEMTDMIGKLNDLIHKNTDFDKFITFFYAEIDIREKTMTYVNAGHNPPYLYHADKSYQVLEAGGLILGMMPGMSYEKETAALAPGDVLVLFTDGVTEAKAANEEFYDEKRLETFMEKIIDENCPMQKCVGKLVEELQRFSQGVPQSDDITMLAMKVLEERGESE